MNEVHVNDLVHEFGDSALSVLVKRYNDLLQRHAALEREKAAAVKAAERAALENQQLWRSFTQRPRANPSLGNIHSTMVAQPSPLVVQTPTPNPVSVEEDSDIEIPSIQTISPPNDELEHRSTTPSSVLTASSEVSLQPPADSIRRVRSSSSNSSCSRSTVDEDIPRKDSRRDTIIPGTFAPSMSSLDLLQDQPSIPVASSQHTSSAPSSPVNQTTHINPSHLSRSGATSPGNSTSHNHAGQSPVSQPRPEMVPVFLPYTTVRIKCSSLTKAQGRESVSFYVQVYLDIPPQADPAEEGGKAHWLLDKPYSDFVAVDAHLRSKASKPELRSFPALPDKALFRDHAPHKSDTRKTMLERFLQFHISSSTSDQTTICYFLNTNIAPLQTLSFLGPTGHTEGWLTKRGRSFGGWQTRYYVLTGETISYYDIPGGTKMGEIPLHHAQIGRQSRTIETGDDSYLHAFLIRTTVKGKHDKDEDVDYILCADSDGAREAWITALTTLQNQKAAARMNGSNTSNTSINSPEQDDPRRYKYRQGSSSTLNANDEANKYRQRRPSADLPPAPSDTHHSSSQPRDPKRSNSEPTSNHSHEHSARKLQPPNSRREKSSDRPATPDKRPSEGKLVASLVSGPMNATPLPSGHEFKKAERSKKTKSSFWNFSRSIVPEKSATPVAVPTPVNRPVFGVPLKDAVAASRIRPGLELPAVVFRCVEYLEAKNAESEEGIFRLSGSANVIRLLKERFNAEGDVQLLQSTEYYDPHAIAGLLKTYLRELPVHILTKELHPEFMAVTELSGRQDRVEALRVLVARLPIEEYTLFRFFFAHLCVIAQNHEVSKMNLRNLGIVFSPTLAIPAPLFTLLLSEFDLIFAVEESTATIPVPVVSEPATQESTQATRPALSAPSRPRPNSELYVATGADTLIEPAIVGRLEDPSENDDEDLVDESVGTAPLNTISPSGAPLQSESPVLSSQTGSRPSSDEDQSQPLSSPKSFLDPNSTLSTSPGTGMTPRGHTKAYSPIATVKDVSQLHGMPSSPRPGASFS